MLYKEKVDDLVVEVNKRKTPDQFHLKEDHELEKYDEVKKKIKKSIKEMITSKIVTVNPENKSENAVSNSVEILSNQQDPIE